LYVNLILATKFKVWCRCLLLDMNCIESIIREHEIVHSLSFGCRSCRKPTMDTSQALGAGQGSSLNIRCSFTRHFFMPVVVQSLDKFYLLLSVKIISENRPIFPFVKKYFYIISFILTKTPRFGMSTPSLPPHLVRSVRHIISGGQ
jgi:hypothetical protein